MTNDAMAHRSMIDLRSDTVTKPTDAMRDAMARAPVGDDVYGEDPTVNQLQDYVAELLGKEAALFVTSGTLGNQLAIKAHTNAGDEVLVDSESHIFHYETAAPSIISNVQLRCVQTERGAVTEELAASIAASVRPSTYYYPTTTLLCLENTHNRYGGAIVPLESLHRASSLAREHRLAFHCDGARLWNACAATGISPREYAAPFDSVNVCLSKGLGAPVGSVLASSRAVIKKAHKWRKILGGGMRQAGILAAAGLHALEQHRALLPSDHANARAFAETLAASPLLHIKPNSVESNLVVFTVNAQVDLTRLVEECQREGVFFASIQAGVARAVFHFQVSAAEAATAATVIVEKARAIAH